MGNTVIIEVTCYIDKPAEMGATIPRVDKDTGSMNIAEREQTGTLLKEIAAYAHAHLPRVCVKYGGGSIREGAGLEASGLSAQRSAPISRLQSLWSPSPAAPFR